jgi:hypothetical protein
MSNQPIYTSKSTVKSLWHEYRVYQNRVELDSPVGLLVIPFEKVEGVDVSESDVAGLLRGELHLTDFLPALKLDWANFEEHVVLEEDSGRLRRVLFTPENPTEFKDVLESALSAYREKNARRS